MSEPSIAPERGVTRRELGLLAAGGLVSWALPGCARSATPRDAARAPRLTLAPGDDPLVALAAVPRGGGPEATERAVRAAALAATDFSWLSRGDRVLLKPVCNSGNAYPATTDPLALRAMIRLLRERGAGRVIVADMSGVQFVRFSPDRLRGSTRALMSANGIAEAVEQAGGELRAFEEDGWDGFFDEAPSVHGSWTGPIWMPALLREVDHVVLLPRCARHLLAGSTLGLKAAVGWWRHDSRLEYHRDAATFAAKTADANTVPSLRSQQRLVLTSATRVLTTFGPDQGFVAAPETGLVLASTSVVAHDMVSLAWLLENRRATPASERDGPIDDPYTSGVLVNLANRVVVYWLGGLGAALRMERLERRDLETVFDDRVLRRAFELAGGVPRVELADADGSVPAGLRARIAAAITPGLA